jgi:protein-tyrosine-phosphatase
MLKVEVEAKKEIGLDISNHKPKFLTMDMLEEADNMITLGLRG